ncbi:hypothetical protein FB593_12029 [Rhizobium sp. SJZ105]|uniref:hypothetical protein n=1 Tax=Rhizobium sp. SJZ105 TaxID=2572678 RepID=UPI0011ADFBF1|nr:hypothetical protein [Rhizobium sp. SJZ105]TWC76456.1 hypothetical protein FB593_12029 [Rhizobium sp. SJZ105]
MAFGLIALVGLLAALSMMVVLPKLETGPQDRKATLADVAYSRRLWPIYAITAFTAGAHFAAYTFAEPFIGAIPDIGPTTVPILLFSFGLAGLLGSVLGGILIDRFMRAVIVCALSTMAIALIVMGWKGPNLGLMGVAACMMSWGVAISMLFASLQTWILKASGPLATPAAAVHTAVLNAAIGFGAVIGAVLLKVSGLSAVMLGLG